ncbi:palmitoyltransferase ZDHHC18-like isoform X1 [Sinocyclocheilus rhinocerous]|uniref:Palmitoyltransferase n=1 Tax=Sinocyclocheilus rhinocerous TaxID=307959 RepID=A0A673MIZ2_9TELE|nr:PREDICTED: palmitoyltransferase ZDHHC18-like isoform X1 [Sinocyclocheilus rhinocerous]
MKNREYQQIDPQALATPTPTPPPRPLPEHKPRRARRRWEVFPGKNRFYCDGRMIVARQSGVLPLTLGLILLTSGLFFIFDCPFLVKHLTSCIPAIGGVLFVFVIISLLQTSFTDPGILPRATPEEAADIEKQIDNPTGSSSSYRPPPRTKEVVINQQVVKLKYCFTCKIFRPPRTSHCSLCDNCVERFDHHCPWVGNCVGKRNYRFFYTFIVSLSFLTAFIFGCVTTHLALRSQGGNGLVFALQASPASALELVVCFFSVWSILGLSGFHTYLVATNLTTNEDIKGSWSGKSGNEDVGNPYSYNSIIKNCCSVLCGPMPPSLIDRRGFVPSDDSVQTSPVEIELPAAKNDINMCTQGTKGLLETASRSPLLTSSCPQAKPQAVLEPLPEIVPEPPKTPHKHHSHHRSKAKQSTHHTPKTSNSSPRPHHSHSSRRKDSKNRDPKFSSLR